MRILVWLVVVIHTLFAMIPTTIYAVCSCNYIALTLPAATAKNPNERLYNKNIKKKPAKE